MEETTLKGITLKEGELQVERTAGTFRSPWVTRRVVLTEVGLYVFEMPSARKKNERGALLLMIPIETINGVMLEQVKKKHFLVLASFKKDHRFLCESEAAASEWRRLLAGAMVGRRKQATVRSRGTTDRLSVRERSMEIAQDLRDVEAARNEETNALLARYLERRTQCVDELMRRELYALRDQAAQLRQAAAAVLSARAAAAAAVAAAASPDA